MASAARRARGRRGPSLSICGLGSDFWGRRTAAAGLVFAVVALMLVGGARATIEEVINEDQSVVLGVNSGRTEYEKKILLYHAYNMYGSFWTKVRKSRKQNV